MKFIDGFGNKRVFCRNCGRSFLEHMNILPNGQKNLLKLESGIYYRPGAVSIRR
jgi:hypothetical protein